MRVLGAPCSSAAQIVHDALKPTNSNSGAASHSSARQFTPALHTAHQSKVLQLRLISTSMEHMLSAAWPHCTKLVHFCYNAGQHSASFW